MGRSLDLSCLLSIVCHEKVCSEEGKIAKLAQAHRHCFDNLPEPGSFCVFRGCESKLRDRDKENTTLARFIRNLESRIYSQLSRQLVENLFGETPSDFGTLTLEGNTIVYKVEDGIITLTITDSDGNSTTISLPVGNFTF